MLKIEVHRFMMRPDIDVFEGQGGQMHTIAVCNQKGGTAKTTTTVCLAGCLASLGQRVLLIDMDPQADSSRWLGVKAPDDTPPNPGLLQVLMGEASIDDIIIESRVESLWIAPSHTNLANANVRLVNEMARESRLKMALSSVSSEWDWVLIDCPPGLELVALNALVAANQVLIPTPTQSLAVGGIARLWNFIGDLNRANASKTVEHKRLL